MHVCNICMHACMHQYRHGQVAGRSGRPGDLHSAHFASSAIIRGLIRHRTCRRIPIHSISTVFLQGLLVRQHVFCSKAFLGFRALDFQS